MSAYADAAKALAKLDSWVRDAAGQFRRSAECTPTAHPLLSSIHRALVPLAPPRPRSNWPLMSLILAWRDGNLADYSHDYLLAHLAPLVWAWNRWAPLDCQLDLIIPDTADLRFVAEKMEEVQRRDQAFQGSISPTVAAARKRRLSGFFVDHLTAGTKDVSHRGGIATPALGHLVRIVLQWNESMWDGGGRCNVANPQRLPFDAVEKHSQIPMIQGAKPVPLLDWIEKGDQS